MSGLSLSFRTDSRLRHFYFEGVTTTGKTLGVGSYGSVVEVCWLQVLSCGVLLFCFQEYLRKVAIF